MNRSETIGTRSGMRLLVETDMEPELVQVALLAPAGKPCWLHWGLRRPGQSPWEAPPPAAWPPESRQAGVNAVQTRLPVQAEPSKLVIRLAPADAYVSLDFALFFPEEQRWDSNDGRNYRILLTPEARAAAALESPPELKPGAGELVYHRPFDLGTQGRLSASVIKQEDRYRAMLRTDLPGPLWLHWGLAQRSPHEWLLPPETLRGAGVVQNLAVETPFVLREGIHCLELEFPLQDAPLGFQFVLKQGEKPERWLKHQGGNFYVPINPGQPKAVTLGAQDLAGLADEIVRAETTHNSWTLMHRFNLCHDFLERARGNLDAQALLFVWLRFSAIRQLTWQRNYNTKPRELAHAQDRLTQKLAQLYHAENATRPLLRLDLSTVGRGGEGQRIRDEILNIMHRHHVKEVSGHFLEEWHQKLHNNTTPDDVVICEAFIEFLRSNGDLGRFYHALEAGGVTRERLQSFERPIRSDPQFVPHLKDGLLHDFYDFLRVLKASHSGTDLETALNAARNQLDGDFQKLLHYIWDHRNDPGVAPGLFVANLTDARRRLSQYLSRDQGLRELLYLDLALEQLARTVVERNIHLSLDPGTLADLIAKVLEQVTLSYEDPELAACCRHWNRLQSLPRFTHDWSLQAKAVVDRIGRALSAWIDHFYQLLQPKAEYLGHGFKAEPWTITLFSEEVVRGNSVGFVLSTLLRHLDPALRKAAHIGDWQVVSRGQGAGKLVSAASLREIQRREFKEPTVILADQVMGDEEIPQGVAAVIAPDVTDIVSHVAVRARNARLLFATCHDPELFARLKSMQGRWIRLDINAAGDVLIEETAAGTVLAKSASRRASRPLTPRRFSRYAIGMDDFADSAVGAKACHLAQLRSRLPDWIRLPTSAAVPFGATERVLSLEVNRAQAKRYEELARQADGGAIEALAGLREALLSLSCPRELAHELRAVMEKAGLDWPQDWEKAWSRIKQVWASKWNERAFLSRRAFGLRHADLSMSVLIQQVVPADYAFVIHTVNPASGNAGELFAEVVLGLGETLVGNYPGRSLSFVWQKQTGQATLLSYPGKSVGLYGAGLIFRSDSNGEDLAGYAGAGLYDSVLLEPPRAVALDYTHEPLVWDEKFRDRLLADIARIGLEVERACGSAQDIEGAVAQGQYHVVQTRPQAGHDTET